MACLAALHLLLVCVAVASAQVPNRCSRTGSSYNRAGMIYYDAPGERVVIKEEHYNGAQEMTLYEEYFFYREKYTLRYEHTPPTHKACYRYTLNITQVFTPVQVPITAQFLDTKVIGTNAVEKFGVTVNVWGDNSGTNGRRILEFVADDGGDDEDCLPVSTTEFGGGSGSFGFRRQSYFDVMSGVDPSYFIPPEFCPKQ